MRRFLPVFSVVLGIMTVGRCFCQQAAETEQQKAEAVVTSLYKQIIFRYPIGIPWKKADRGALWPLLSRDLIRRMNAAADCEKDYVRQYPDPNLKPAFDWLEFGLFSGGMEQAGPSRVAVLHATKQENGSYRVRVRLSWWGDSDKHRRPPNPAHIWNWEVVAFVVRDGKRLVLNDVLYSKDTDEGGLRLSQLLAHGCNNGKWVGYSEEQQKSAN